MSVTNPLKIIFAGTPDFAAHHLQVLLDSRHEVIAVYTQPDRPAGRGKKLLASPVKQLAQTHNIPVFQPVNFKAADDQTALTALGADIMVVVAYGLLLPQVVLNAPKLGCINVHASLLPRWRGAAPIQRALAAGDSETGVTIMQMDIGLDTGAMLVKASCPILDNDTGGTLHDRLLTLGGPALLQALEQLASNSCKPEEQDDTLSCYAAKISKEEVAVDWNDSAAQIELNIRAFNPFPVCHTSLDSERLRIYAAQVVTNTSDDQPGTILNADKKGITVACGKDALRLTELQLPGKKAMPVDAVMNGYAQRFAVGTQLGKA